jgi:hypothetical protein
MTSGSRLEIFGLLSSVGGFHDVQAYSGVFLAISPFTGPSWRWGQWYLDRFLEWLLQDVFAWWRHLLTRGWIGGRSSLPPTPAYGSQSPTEGIGPTYKTSFGLIVVMVNGIHRGKGCFPGSCYLTEGLSSWVPAYGIFGIINGFLPGVAYPLVASWCYLGVFPRHSNVGRRWIMEVFDRSSSSSKLMSWNQLSIKKLVFQIEVTFRAPNITYVIVQTWVNHRIFNDKASCIIWCTSQPLYKCSSS